MTIQITLDDSAVQVALYNLTVHVNNLQPAMDDIGEALVGLIQGQLNRGETPWGDAFYPLSEAYLDANPRREGGIPLNDTHQHIMNRINSHAGSDFAYVGIKDNPDTPGLAIEHQFGGNVPARPYLPIYNGQADLPHAWTAEVLNIIQRHINLKL